MEQQALGQWKGEIDWYMEGRQAGESMLETEPDTLQTLAHKPMKNIPWSLECYLFECHPCLFYENNILAGHMAAQQDCFLDSLGPRCAHMFRFRLMESERKWHMPFLMCAFYMDV